MIESEEDCRRKYVARQLFRKLASESRLSNRDLPDPGSFKLFCDDLRPTNILLDDDMRIVAVIDWEFTYAAPADFAYSPPWWLLLEMPEEWPGGISDWVATYEPRLETFLRVLKAREDAHVLNGTMTEAHRLSERMRKSWDTGEFWAHYAARKSWAFDTVWPIIDKKFFGGSAGFEERIALLSSEERMMFLGDKEKEMQGFVRRKLEARKNENVRQLGLRRVRMVF